MSLGILSLWFLRTASLASAAAAAALRKNIPASLQHRPPFVLGNNGAMAVPAVGLAPGALMGKNQKCVRARLCISIPLVMQHCLGLSASLFVLAPRPYLSFIARIAVVSPVSVSPPTTHSHTLQTHRGDARRHL